MKNKTIVLNIIVMLMLILSACTTSAPSSTSEEDTSPEVEETEASTEEIDEEEVAEVSEEPAELTLIFPTFRELPEDMEKVQEELDRITLEKINATVKLEPLSIGVYQEQTNLMLTSGESFDLLWTSISMNFQSYADSGLLYPLDDLIDQYGDGVLTAVGEDYLQAAMVSEELFGVPTIRDMAANTEFTMRADIVDEYNIDISQIDSLESLEAILEVVYENEPEMAPLIPNVIGGTILDTYLPYDPLGDTMGVLMDYGQNFEVVNLFETEEYESWVKLIREWYVSGYILEDIATSTSDKYTILGNDAGFGYVARAKPGWIAQETAATGGMDFYSVEFGSAFANTSTVANVMWSIPYASENPDKAMQFLNLLYSDAEVFNLIVYGIEGEHFVKVSDNIIDYPEGVTADTVSYDLGYGWLFGNQFLMYIREGEDPNLWNDMKTFNDNAIKSQAMGFVFDNSSVKNEVAAVTNVLDQYQLGLETGTIDPETELPKFIQALKDAGIEMIIAEKQTQLDAWAAGSN